MNKAEFLKQYAMTILQFVYISAGLVRWESIPGRTPDISIIVPFSRMSTIYANSHKTIAEITENMSKDMITISLNGEWLK